MSRPKRAVVKPKRWGNTLEPEELQKLIELEAEEELAPAPPASVVDAEGAVAVAAVVDAPGEAAMEVDQQVEVKAGKGKKRSISDVEDEGSSQEKEGQYDRKLLRNQQPFLEILAHCLTHPKRPRMYGSVRLGRCLKPPRKRTKMREEASLPCSRTPSLSFLSTFWASYVLLVTRQTSRACH